MPIPGPNKQRLQRVARARYVLMVLRKSKKPHGMKISEIHQVMRHTSVSSIRSYLYELELSGLVEAQKVGRITYWRPKEKRQQSLF